MAIDEPPKPVTGRNMNVTTPYDVFLCHNIRDKRFVLALKHRLESEGYRTWYDDSHLQAGGGRTLVDQIHEAVSNCRAAIITYGGDGFGVFQESEEIGLLNGRPDMSKIPVLIPGATASDARRAKEAFQGEFYLDFSQNHPEQFPQELWAKLINTIGPPIQQSNTTHTKLDHQSLRRECIDLATRVAGGGLSIFIGSTWRNNLSHDLHPDPEELANFLLKQATGHQSNGPHEPITSPSFEEAARIFELKHNQDELHEVAIADFINARTTKKSNRFDAIANMLQKVMDLRYAAHPPSTTVKRALMVYSTNVDLRLERSLILHKVPFVRLVVHGGGRTFTPSAYNRIDILANRGYQLTGPTGEVRQLRPDNTNQESINHIQDQRARIISSLTLQNIPPQDHPGLSEVTETIHLSELLQDPAFAIDKRDFEDGATTFEQKLNRNELPGLILIKLLGSTGVRQSFALTSNQIMSLPKFEKNMPALFRNALRQQPIAFFDFSPAESMFQKIYHVFLHNKQHFQGSARFIMENFAQANDQRGALERIIGVDKIGSALMDQLGVEAISASPKEYCDLFLAEYSLQMSRERRGGGFI